MNNTATLQEFSDSLVEHRPTHVDAAFLQSVIACLRADNVKNAGAIAAGHSVLVTRLSVLPDLNFAALEQLEPPVRELLLTYLVHNILMEEVFEKILVRLRRTLLFNVLAGDDVGPFGLDVLSALGVFAFGKEYVFAETAGEREALAKLNLYNGPLHVAAIACYRPLYRLHQPVWLLSTEMPSTYFAKMLQVQLTEPLEELRLRVEIESLAPITDATSVAVQQMYEENPYPRWTNRPVARGKLAGNYSDVLVAGCGSGQHPIFEALYRPASKVVGLDLSMASLGYASRKSCEYGLTNLKFVHGDILDVKALGRSFDFISSAGVLHHMADPLKGLQALASVLAENGRMEIALYSEAGRRVIVQAIAMREQLNIPGTSDGIRALREHILALPVSAPARGITEFADFYSMSGCRDLIFHVQEHRLDLTSVDRLVRDAGLVLKKFLVTPAQQKQFQAQIPDGDPHSLLDWAKFEAMNPAAFASMYRLALVKPSGGRR